ncbi:hypothetical protein RFI_00233 [Reticulomyxa filosa]|uniref:OTU domain-containing protein n=1 Tax=Reticulomyxa filosa TaxID=46433 RepID=X6PE98_RETFI|nr:hypothetical protein RFI_00233 [Reticulomyxa filosa]|eukprot:ETO36830.1 hypothetical protein RFI_00233 [Reticulomyxa filosa]
MSDEEVNDEKTYGICLTFEELKTALEGDGFRVHVVKEDCNNLFRCVSCYFENTEEDYWTYRESCSMYIEGHTIEFIGLMDESDLEQYCEKLKKKSSGNETLFASKVELYALTRRYRLNIRIYGVDGIREVIFEKSGNCQTIELIQRNDYFHILKKITYTGEKGTSRPEASNKNTLAASNGISWKFGIFGFFCVLSVIWGFVFFLSQGTAYLWVSICGIIESLFGMYHFTSLIKLQETVDKIHKENLRYKKNNFHLTNELQELQIEVERLKNIRISLESDKDILTRAYHTYKGFNEKFQQLLDGKTEHLKCLKHSSQSLIKRWQINLVKREKSIWNKLWDFFESASHPSQNSANCLTRLQFEQLIANLPMEFQVRYRNVRGKFPKQNIITYKQFSGLIDYYVNQNTFATNTASY